MAARRKSEQRVLEIAPDNPQDDAARTALLELVTQETENRNAMSGAVVGTLTGLGESGQALVTFAVNGTRWDVPACSTVALGAGDRGRAVVLVFEQNDLRRPIVVGLIQEPGAGQSAGAPPDAGQSQTRDVEVDGERLLLTAQKEIILRCGKATIILTRAGKILIRGAYLLNRSSGVNRIKGGSVQIN
jgi:hypothetical protein